MNEDLRHLLTDRPKTYDEAVAEGYERVDDIAQLLAANGLPADAISSRRDHNFTKSNTTSCMDHPTNEPCFDFCYANGLRILAYCGPTHQCDRYVQGTCDPY